MSKYNTIIIIILGIYRRFTNKLHMLSYILNNNLLKIVNDYDNILKNLFIV